MENALECPNCHRIANDASNGARLGGRCPTCGFRLIMSMREKEAEVRERLYGHPVTRSREPDLGKKTL